MTVGQLAADPHLIEQLYKELRAGMPAPTKFKLPYRKAVREQELKQSLVENFDIDVDRAKAKVVTGCYDGDGVIFPYAIEAAIAPRNYWRYAYEPGSLEFIGYVNDSPAIDGGEKYFAGGPNTYSWVNKKTGKQEYAATAKEILQGCGFDTFAYHDSKKRVPCVFLINLRTNVRQWMGSAGKTQINLTPFAKDIAQLVSWLAYQMPTCHGMGLSQVSYPTSTKDPSQEVKHYLLEFLNERRAAVKADPSIKIKRRITQQGVWYLIEPKMKANNFEPAQGSKGWGKTREYLVEYIPKAIKELWPDEDITREDLGIIAGARAVMHFNRLEEPISKDNISRLAQTKTTDMIIIEKEGVADALTEFADEHKVALVFTRGRFVKYVKELVEEASNKKISNVHIWVITDYDVDGIEIAQAALNVPRIGVDISTVEWLQRNGYTGLKISKVEEEHYSRDAENRTRDRYLWNKRIEIDAILAQVGGEGLWKYLMHQITTISPIRNYTPIIEQPEIEALYPADIRLALANVQDFVNRLVEDRWEQILDNELREVRGKLLRPEKKEEGISASLKQIIEDHKGEIIEKSIEEFTAIRGNNGRSTN